MGELIAGGGLGHLWVGRCSWFLNKFTVSVPLATLTLTGHSASLFDVQLECCIFVTGPRDSRHEAGIYLASGPGGDVIR